MRYTVRYTNSAGDLESEEVDQSQAVALLSKLMRLGAHSITVQSPDGQVMSGGQAIRQFDVSSLPGRG
jgi:hypothetical protein